MMKEKIGGLLLLSIIIFSCGSKKAAVGDTSQNSLDWSGVYLFTDEDYKLPEIQLTLNENGTYNLISSAVGEETRNGYMEGKFEWDKQGRTIRLDKQIPRLQLNQLLVGENTLFVLRGKNDQSVNELSQFQKVQTNAALTEKYWKLVSINERTVTKDDFMAKEPHMIFKSEFSRVNGSDGCNGFGGVFKLEGNKMTFSKMMSTLMACPDSFVYEQFMRILQEELTYEVNEEQLVIRSSNDVMKFEVVYL